jgi:hypothetical protein
VRPTETVRVTELYVLVFVWLTIWQCQVEPVGRNTRGHKDLEQRVVIDSTVLDYLSKKLSLVDISLQL